jgi:hypothetical protein
VRVRRVRRRPARTGIAVVALVTFFLGVSACGGVRDSVLRSRLLTIHRVPAGWTVSATPAPNGLGCLANMIQPTGSSAASFVEVEFVSPATTPAVIERLASYNDPAAVFAQIVAKLKACRELHGVRDGERYDGTVRQLDSSRFGASSASFKGSCSVASRSPITSSSFCATASSWGSMRAASNQFRRASSMPSCHQRRS